MSQSCRRRAVFERRVRSARRSRRPVHEAFAHLVRLDDTHDVVDLDGCGTRCRETDVGITGKNARRPAIALAPAQRCCCCNGNAPSPTAFKTCTTEPSRIESPMDGTTIGPRAATPVCSRRAARGAAVLHAAPTAAGSRRRDDASNIFVSSIETHAYDCDPPGPCGADVVARAKYSARDSPRGDSDQMEFEADGCVCTRRWQFTRARGRAAGTDAARRTPLARLRRCVNHATSSYPRAGAQELRRGGHRRWVRQPAVHV